MNRFDRVTALLLLLQTRSVVTAKFLAEHFGVTERTVYRDIRTLENAGVPIGSEAGVGYFLEKGYHLPPVSFTLDEASSLLLGEKLTAGRFDAATKSDFETALNKVRSVLDSGDKDYLSALDADVMVVPANSVLATGVEVSPDAGITDVQDRWLRECRGALVRRQVVQIDYTAGMKRITTTRHIEPIGLFYYSHHWHLIAWCRLREDYRDFRLDRVTSFQLLSEQFSRRSHDTLEEYLSKEREVELAEVVVVFEPDVARFVGEQRYMFGFVDEEYIDDGIRMSFRTAVPEYMARWLLQYTSGVRIVSGESVRTALGRLSRELVEHWSFEG